MTEAVVEVTRGSFLARYARPDILNTRGEIVGGLRVSFPALG